jgi:hypothetical protein
VFLHHALVDLFFQEGCIVFKANVTGKFSGFHLAIEQIHLSFTGKLRLVFPSSASAHSERKQN